MDQPDWNAFCDALKEAGGAIVRSECPDGPSDRAEGYRYLLGFLHSTLSGFLYDAGPEAPAFVRIMDDVVKFGLDCPDGINSYVATVRDDLTYRIWGHAGTVRYIGWQFMAPGRGSVANISLHDFEVDPDGTFEIWISKVPREGNWFEMPSGVDRIGLRQFQYDWREQYAEIHIEAEGIAPSLPRCLQQRPSPEQFADAVKSLGTGFAVQSNFWIDFIHSFRAGGDNIVPPAVILPEMGGNRLQSAANGYWSLRPDEALLLEFVPPEARYWSVCLGNFWYATLDYAYHQSSLNGSQARFDEDGACRIVVSRSDPSLANWLDTVGHEEGTITFRWLLADEVPEVRSRVVAIADLDDVLPSGTARVSPEERDEVLAMRRESVGRRFGLPTTTRWSYEPLTSNRDE